MLVGVDTGGTFTDLVAADGTTTKVLSSPDDPSAAVAAALDEVGARGSVDRLAHGTTVATNALLERRGAVVALVTNAGFEDVIEIARQDRPSLYDPFADRPEPLVARAHRYGVRGRLDAHGEELDPVSVDSMPAIGDGVEAVAVCLLHSDLSDVHERAVGSELERRGFDVSCSVDVSPEFREYERTLTTVVNAYLRPVCRDYLRRLAPLADEVLVLSSAGGLLPLDVASDLPAALLLSGPAGGVLAAAEVAAANGFADCVTFDMGGTSTDVCLVRSGTPEPAAGRVVGGFPIRMPSLDVHTIGAGGGSIARIDPGGALTVGPRSAGAAPGPACYGQGGSEPTVTDADLLLGRIDVDGAFPGIGRLDRAAADRACRAAGVDPAGVIAVVDAAMEEAIRLVTVARGVDPRQLALVAFGGAGPLHACALADALGMAAVVVPDRAGVLSAAGILTAPLKQEVISSWPGDLDAMVDEARRRVHPSAEAVTAFDCRYVGQSHELTVPNPDAFHAEHLRQNGYERPDDAVEVVALRVRASYPSPVRVTELPSRPRAGGAGPLVLNEPDCTIWIPDGWVAEPGDVGALVLRRRP